MWTLDTRREVGTAVDCGWHSPLACMLSQSPMPTQEGASPSGCGSLCGQPCPALTPPELPRQLKKIKNLDSFYVCGS